CLSRLDNRVIPVCFDRIGGGTAILASGMRLECTRAEFIHNLILRSTVGPVHSGYGRILFRRQMHELNQRIVDERRRLLTDKDAKYTAHIRYEHARNLERLSLQSRRLKRTVAHMPDWFARAVAIRTKR